MQTIAAPSELTRVTTPKGHEALFATRPGTSDSALVGGIVGEDEYGLVDLPDMRGWAIDIGAHIGTVAIALALDHPNLMVLAVEALPENVELLRANITRATYRIKLEAAAAGAPGESIIDVTYGWSKADNQPDHYMTDNRFIGGMVGANDTSRTIACPAVSLDDLLIRYDISEVELLKIDCEGCEWFFLTSPEIVRCKRIWGEFHIGRHGNAARLRELLEPTHDVEMDDSKVVGLFRATRR